MTEQNDFLPPVAPKDHDDSLRDLTPEEVDQADEPAKPEEYPYADGPYDDEDDAEDEDDDDGPEPLDDVELDRVNVNFLLNVRGISSLREGIDIAAKNLGMYGLNGFYILATHPDTKEQWVYYNGEILEVDDLDSALVELTEEAGDNR